METTRKDPDVRKITEVVKLHDLEIYTNPDIAIAILSQLGYTFIEAENVWVNSNGYRVKVK